MSDLICSGAPCGVPPSIATRQRPTVPPRSLANNKDFPSGDQPIIVSLLDPVAAATCLLPSTAKTNTSRGAPLVSPTRASKPRYFPSGEKNSSVEPLQSDDFNTRSEPSITE